MDGSCTSHETVFYEQGKLWAFCRKYIEILVTPFILVTLFLNFSKRQSFRQYRNTIVAFKYVT